MKALRRIYQKTHRRGLHLLLILSLSLILSVGALLATQPVHATTAIYSLNVNSLNGMWPPPSTIENPVELTGNFSVISGSGLEKQYGIMIDWGDGTPDTIFRWYDPNNGYPYVTWNPNEENTQTFNGTFTTNPGGGYQDMGHIYAAEGTYNMSIKLFHSQLGGSPGTVVGMSFIEHVLVAMLDVSKSAPTYAHEGDLIRYNVTVTNPSQSTPMYKISVVDSIFGNISNDFPSILNPQQYASKTYAYTVPSPSGGKISSNVTAVYHDAANHTTTSFSSWTVTVLHPNIAVAKVGPAYAHAGDIINYTLTVVNTGDCSLYNVTVDDTLLGIIALNASLPAGQNQTLVLAYTVPSTLEINNTAIASGFDVLGLEVSDTTSWSTTVQYQITIAPSTSGADGGTFNVTYTKEGITYTDVNGTTPWTEWVDSGALFTVSSPEGIISGGSGVRYVFDSFDPFSSFVVTESTNVTLVYTTQYYLTVTSPYEIPPGEGWHDEGETVYLTLTNGTYAIIPGQTQAVFLGWSADASGTELTSDPIFIDSAKTAVADWKVQHYITITSTHGSPPDSSWIDQGSDFTVSVTSPTEVVPNDSQYISTGFSVDGGVSQAGTSYNFTDVQTAHNIAFSWKQQFWIQIDSAHDSPTNSQWLDRGDGLTVSVTSPADDDDAGTRYRCTGYTLDSNPIFINGAISHNFSDIQDAHSITFNWVVQYRLSVSSAHGSSDPAVGDYWYDSGELVSVLVTSPADDNGAGTRYRYTDWSGTGIDPIYITSNFVSFFITQPSTFTWNWAAQYYLTVSSAHDTPTPTSGWFDAGTNITASVSTPILGSTGTQYASTGWSGSGSVPEAGYNSAVEFTIDAASTLTWNWKTQHYLTVISPHATPIGMGWYDSGTTAYASLNTGTLVSGWGTRYVFVLWTGDASGNGVTSEEIAMNGPKTAVADWMTQYYLTLTGNPLGVPTPTGAGWYEAGTNASVSTLDFFYVNSYSRWRFNGWTTGDMNKIMNSSSHSTTVKMDGPIIVMVNYDFQFKIVFDASANVRFDGTNPILYVNGVAKSAWDLPFTVFVNRDQSISYSYVNPVASMLDGKRYRWDSTGGLNQALQTSNFNVTESGIILGSYVDQYRVIIFSAHDSPSITVGQHWFDSGTSLTMSIMSPANDNGAGTRYRFTGWTGTGSVPSSGIDTAFMFNVNAPSTLTWNWIAQYYFMVTSSHDSPTGEGWYDAGTTVSSVVTSPFNEEAGIRYIALGFTGTGSAPLSGLGAEVSFPLYMPSTIAWGWKTQFLVTFEQTGLDASASGAVIAVNGSPKTCASLPFQEWMDNGSEMNYLYQTLVLSSQTGKRFILVSTTDTASPINVTAPIRFVGNYKTQYYLAVSSAYSAPTPSNGWFDAGTLVNASIASPFQGAAGTRYACTGWTGTGSIPSFGMDAAFVFTISESSSLTWNWKTQYYLTLSTNFGTNNPNSGWYDESSTVLINASAPTGEIWSYQWHGWMGAGTGSYSGLENSVSVSMNGPIEEASYWKAVPNLIVFVSNETIAKCDRVSVYGTTAPVNSVVPLEITYTFPNGRTITRTVMTDEQGRFADLFLLDNSSPYGVFAQGGQWVINVTRGVDGSNEAATSYTTLGIKAPDNNLFILAALAISLTVAVVGSYLFMRKRTKDKKLSHKAWRWATVAIAYTGLVFGIIALLPNWMAINGTALINGQTYLVSFSLNPFQTGAVSITGIEYAGTPMPSLISPAWSTVPRNPGPIFTLYLLPVGSALALISLYKPRTSKERTIKVITLMVGGALMLIPIVSSIIFMAVQSSVVTGASTGYALGLFMAMIGGLAVLLSSAFAAGETPAGTLKPTDETVPKYEEETWIENK